MTQFSEPQKSELRKLLANPLLQAAFESALSSVLVNHSGAATVESCALNYKVQEGAKLVVSTLYASVDAKKEVAATHRRFKPETSIV